MKHGSLRRGHWLSHTDRPTSQRMDRVWRGFDGRQS